MQKPDNNLERLFRDHYERMYRTAYLLLRDPEEAKDAVSDVFARLWDSHTTVRQDSAAAYLVISVRNHCLNRLQQQHIIPINGQEPMDFNVPAELETADEEMEQTLCQALMQLTPQKRAILRLRYREELSYKETAERLGISVSTVNKHIVQALHSLREYFKTTAS